MKMGHPHNDYSLVGKNADRAIALGLVNADWYQSAVPRETMAELLKRRNWPGVRDTIVWFTLLASFAYLGLHWWGHWYAIIPIFAYGTIYASSSDSRWHESSHGTAFKADWLNNSLYEIASFMVMRESTVWRWSHTRHHSDTIIIGRDPEIVISRPPNMRAFYLKFSGLPAVFEYIKKVALHCRGRLDAEEASYIPASERALVFLKARIYVLIYAMVILSCCILGSILPLLFIGLPNIYGAWLMPIYGLTQHVGLPENVLDHRLNCRTVEMNYINRFLYWNMNFHIEHHMFPLVPYYNLPSLHQLLAADMPKPYSGLYSAWQEIITTLRRQVHEPDYVVHRILPQPLQRSINHSSALTLLAEKAVDSEGWVYVGKENLLNREDVLRFDYKEHTFAIYRTANDQIYATDGFCTHGNSHLSHGLVVGNIIECAKHNGRFDVRDGTVRRGPPCRSLPTYPVRVEDGSVAINIKTIEGLTANQPAFHFRVVSNHNVATFIKELLLEPIEVGSAPTFLAGQYLQFVIPPYGDISFSQFDIAKDYVSAWKINKIFGQKASNLTTQNRNYSFANNPEDKGLLRFNVRIATSPPEVNCSAGVGSTYMWRLKPGDEVTANGPFGDFKIQDTKREMVYVGGGAGMAPLMSQLSYLFETLQSQRVISYWYGARSKKELFYQEYIENLATEHDNFSYYPALSNPKPQDGWTSYTGNIHEVLYDIYLKNHTNIDDIEFYLCGPELMIQASCTMLTQLGVKDDRVFYDEF